MNRRFAKDPPRSTAFGVVSRKSLIREGVRRRRAGLGIGVDPEEGDLDGSSRAPRQTQRQQQQRQQQQQQTAHGNKERSAAPSDGPIETLGAARRSAPSRHSPVPQTPPQQRSLHTTSSSGSYGFLSAERAPGASPSLDPPPSPVPWNPSFGAFSDAFSPEGKLWNPSFASDGSPGGGIGGDSSSDGFGPAIRYDVARRPHRPHQQHPQRAKQRRQGVGPASAGSTDRADDDGSSGLELAPAEWSEMRSPPPPLAPPEQGGVDGVAAARQKSSVNVSRARAIVARRNARKKAPSAAPARTEAENRSDRTAESSPRASEGEEGPRRIGATREKETRLPPQPPTEAPPRRLRIRPGSEADLIVAPASSVFSEDDSLFSDFPRLRAVGRDAREAKERRGGASGGRGSSAAASASAASPTAEKLGGARPRVGAGGRGVGGFARRSSKEEEEGPRPPVPRTAAVVTPTREDFAPARAPRAGAPPVADRPEWLLADADLSAVPTSEEVHDAHVSIDSRDIGECRPRRPAPEGGSAGSCAAPSFDEAASGGLSSRKNGSDEAVRATRAQERPLRARVQERPLRARGAMLWGGQFLGRSEPDVTAVEDFDEEKADGQPHNISSDADVTLDISKEADLILNNKKEVEMRSEDVNKDAEHQVLNREEISVSMMKLVESAVQEATWSKQGVNPLKGSNANQHLPPIHPVRSTVAKDETVGTQRRMQYPTRNKNAVPSITEFSPTRSDHSADAAAGAKQLHNLIFGPLRDEAETDGGEKKEPAKTQVAVPKRTSAQDAMSVDSWEVDIIGSRGPSPSTVVVSEDGSLSEFDPDNIINQAPSAPNTSNLNAKLEMLRNTAVPGTLTANHGDEISSVSGRVSVASVQPSVESACVRQNADIALLMEDTMMDFMVMDGEREDASMYSEVAVEDASLQGAPNQQQAMDGEREGPSVYSELAVEYTSLQQAPSQDSGLLSDPAFHFNEPQSSYHPEFYQLHYTPPPPPNPKPVMNKSASRHQYFSKKHFPSLLSVDEEEEFSEPSFTPRASPKSSNNSSPKSSSKTLKVLSKHKDLGKFLDQFRDHFMTGCAPLMDEDLASSWVFSQENSSFLAGGADNWGDESSDHVTPLPFSKGPTPEERAMRRRDDTTPLRTNTTKSKAVSYGMHASSNEMHSSSSTKSHLNKTTHDTKVPFPSQSQGEVQMQSAFNSVSPRTTPLDNGGMDFHPTDVFQSHERQEVTSQTQKHQETTNSKELEVAEDYFNEAQLGSSPRSPREEFGRTSERERQKSKSLHWNSNNGVNEDEQISFTPTRAKVSARVLAARTSLSSFSTSQALIRQHFRDSLFGDLYDPDDDKRKLEYINECSREEDTDSSDYEAAVLGDNDGTPEYEYDDFIRDFSSIVEAESDRSSTEQRDDKSGESRAIDDQEEPPSLSTDRSSTQYETNSVSIGNRGNSLVDNSSISSKSLGKSLIQTQTNQSHPHHVPNSAMEVSKAQLEEKLRGMAGTSKDCGSSVATSDLGSIMTRESEISRSFNYPKMIFHRTNPPIRTPDSAHSSPSSITYGRNILQNVKGASPPRMNVLSSENHSPTNPDPNDDVTRSQELLRSQQDIDPNDDVLRSQEVRRAQEARDQNADVIASKRLLRNNVSSATTSAATINEQLNKLRSIRNNQVRDCDGAEAPSVQAAPTNNRSFVRKQTGIDDKSTPPGNNQPQPVSNGVGALRWKYQQSISNASSTNASAATHRMNNSLSFSARLKPIPANQDRQTEQQSEVTKTSTNVRAATHRVNNMSSSSTRPKSIPANQYKQAEQQSQVTKISNFWNQLEFSRDSSTDKISPKLTTRKFQKRPSVSDIRNQYDDASQQSGDIFEIAPRGSGYGILNKNQWINHEASIGEDRSVGVHDIYESASHHAFEVTPLVAPGNTVVAKLPSRSKLHRPQNAPYLLNKSPLQRYSSAPHYSSLSSTTSIDDSIQGSKPPEQKTIGSRVASSPFLKKTSATAPKSIIPTPNQNPSPAKVSNARNLFSNGWKNSPDKKPPTVLNRSIATEKLNSRFNKSSKKNDSSWIAKQDTKGKNDNSWISR